MSDVPEILASLANVAIAAIAFWALIIARRQIALARETSIREAYEHYHEVLLQYPQFTTGDVQFELLSDEEFGRYETFVLYTLMVGERVFDLFPHHVGWHHAIKDDIRLHKRFIGSDRFQTHLENQEWTTMQFIEEVLAEPNGA